MRNGALGAEGVDTQNTPMRVFEGVQGVSAGESLSLLLTADAGGQRAIWGSGYHQGSPLTPSVVSSSPTHVRLASDDYVSVSAGGGFSLAVKQDTTLATWGQLGHPAVTGFALGHAGAGDDPDQDGLTTAREMELGTDPWNADSNGDGISDGLAVSGGHSPLEVDMDGDGVLNAAEIARGTDPFRADTDGDAVSDAADCFPIDPARWQCPAAEPGDTTPPVITLTDPSHAVPVP